MLEAITPDCSNLSDYTYVNNFKDEDRSDASENFLAGQATKFQKDYAEGNKFPFRKEFP